MQNLYTVPACSTERLRAAAAHVADFFAVIGSEYFYGAAHFVEARTNALADALGERVFDGRRTHANDARAGRRRSTARGGVRIEEIRGEQGDAFFVVTRIQNVTDRLERPKRWLARTDVVKHQNLRLKDRLEYAHLGSLTLGVVAVLNFLQQLAVIVKKPAVPAQDDFLERGDSQMRLAHAARAHQQQAVLALHFANGGELLSETLDDEFRLREAGFPCGELVAGGILDLVVRFVVFEVAVAISLGNARASEHAFGAIACGAIAGNGPHHFGFPGCGTLLVGGERLRALGGALDNFPAAALADGTI